MGQVAKDLIITRGIDSEDLSVIMPSQRARTFLSAEIASLANGRALWQPRYLSMDEMMCSVTSLIAADRFRLITELYKIYSRYHNEDFDHFYSWGNTLIRDFDTIDNYMVDAKALFANISDLKDIDTIFAASFTQGQRSAIGSFWSGVLSGSKVSDQKKRFLSIWNTLLPIYNEFREKLSSEKIGYKGMIYRMAADRLSVAKVGDYFGSGDIAVVGFNALSSSEKILLEYLKKQGAIFYWDVDNHLLEDHVQECAKFVRENIKLFGQSLSSQATNNYTGTKSIRVVEAPSNSVQCRYAASFLEQNYKGSLTGVILTDEKMLLPLLYSLPESIGAFNVTLGYDVKNTPAYTLIEYLVRLQQQLKESADGSTRFFRADVESIFDHTYLTGLASDGIKERIRKYKKPFIEVDVSGEDAIFSTIFTPTKSLGQMQEYLEQVCTYALQECSDKMGRESLSLVVETLAKVSGVIRMCDIDISLAIYLSLLRKHIATLELPFIGEPLIGVQVMGILESRNIDFENIIIISAQEDHFPGNLIDRSFVPHNLKKGFGLPTVWDHEAMYAYYFYRLLHRAKRVEIVYCSTPDGVSTGEPSRYIRQLEYDSIHKIEHSKIDIAIKPHTSAELEPMVKNSDIMSKLQNYLGERATISLSPSSISRYIECPYMFYLHDIKGIKIYEEMGEEVDAAGFGTAMHYALEMLYSKYDREGLANVKTSEIEHFVDHSLCEQLEVGVEDFSGATLSMRSFITHYTRSIIEYDTMRGSEFKLLNVEEKISSNISFIANGNQCSVKVKGVIDRVDMLPSGITRIIDYKSGALNKQTTISSIDDLMAVGSPKFKKPPFQALLYAMMMKSERGGRYQPALYFARDIGADNYLPILKIDKENVYDYDSVAASFEEAVKSVLGELFSADVPFDRCEDAKRCTYCKVRAICGR